MSHGAADADEPALVTEREDERHGEQREADERRRLDQIEKLERDGADERGRRAREGT